MEESKAVCCIGSAGTRIYSARTPSPSTQRCKINHSKTLIQLNKIYFNLNRFQLLPLLLVLLPFRTAQFSYVPNAVSACSRFHLKFNLHFLVSFSLCEMMKNKKCKKEFISFLCFLRASFLCNAKIHQLPVCLSVCEWVSESAHSIRLQ